MTSKVAYWEQYPPPDTGGGASGVDTQDEGVPVDTPATILNFTGGGVTATGGGGTTTVNTVPGSGAPWTEVEIDFGTKPVWDKNFAITDAAITSTDKIAVVESGSVAADRVAGDAQWDALELAALAGTGNFTLYATADPGPIVGKRRILYSTSGGTGGGGPAGVNTQDEGIAVDTPATTINFVGNLYAATGGGGTTTLTGNALPTTKGDIWTYGSANAREPVGADNTLPVADSTLANGWSWKDPTVGPPPSPVSPSFSQKRIFLVNGYPGDSGAGGTIGLVAGTWTIPGSFTTENPNYTTAWLAIGKAVWISTAGAGSSIEGRWNPLLTITQQSTISFAGGYQWLARVGIHTHTATSRCFYGLLAGGAAIGNVDPSTLTDMVGFGADSGDANLQFMVNDAAGTATKTDLGAGFPARSSATDFYECMLVNAPGNDTAIAYWIKNWTNGGAIASGIASANLPTSAADMRPRMWLNNGSTATLVRLAFSKFYIETDW